MNNCENDNTETHNKFVMSIEKPGFYYRTGSCFSLKARRKLASATFLPLLDYRDVLHMNTFGRDF